METRPDSPNGDLQYRRDLGVAEITPSDQEENLTIACLQVGQRSSQSWAQQVGIHPVDRDLEVVRRTEPGRLVARQGSAQCPVPGDFLPLVPPDEIRPDSIEPRTHVHPVSAVITALAECGQEGFAEEVIGQVAHTATQVAVDCRRVPVENLSENLWLVYRGAQEVVVGAWCRTWDGGG